MTFYSQLTDRGVLAVSGPDARDFLQGLITKDMRKLTPGALAFAALLSPQGRFLFDFFLQEQEGTFWLETDKARLPDLAKRLMMYRLRAKVEVAELPQMKVAAVWGGASEPGLADPRLAELGRRIIAETLPEMSAMTQGDYDLHRITLGVPEGAKDLIADRSILLEYGYDELHAVDFDKGCYVGQEVTARSKHRATLRKFIHQVSGKTDLPPKGTPVTAGGRELGVMASSAGALGLAHLRVEEVKRAAREQMPLIAGGAEIAAALPFWCATAFAEG